MSIGIDMTLVIPMLPRKQHTNELPSQFTFDIKTVWQINAGDFQDVISGYEGSLKIPSKCCHVEKYLGNTFMKKNI